MAYVFMMVDKSKLIPFRQVMERWRNASLDDIERLLNAEREESAPPLRIFVQDFPYVTGDYAAQIEGVRFWMSGDPDRFWDVWGYDGYKGRHYASNSL